MTIGLKKAGKILARYGSFELRKLGNSYLLVRNGYGLCILSKQEIIELSKLLGEFMKKECKSKTI